MSAPGSQIFRQASLDRLSSPEQLDTLLQVTTPKGWLALASLGALLVAGVAWSVVGRIPTRVGGEGILVKKGGLQGVSAIAAGQLSEIYVHAGDVVKAGQTVARLSLPDLAAELETAKARLAAAESQNRQLATFGSEDTRLQSAAITEQRQVATEAIATAKEKEAAMQAKLASQQQLLTDGLITEQVVQTTRDSLTGARADIARAQAQLKELSVREGENRQRLLQEGDDRSKRIDEAHLLITQLQDKIEHDSVVKSPEAGRVLEVRTAPGAVVAAGTPLLMLERVGQDSEMEAIVYVPATDGKKIQEGMRVEVSPSTVKREEFGSLRATVTTVSAFPSTQQAMLAELGNADLVSSFFREIDTPIELRVALQPTTATATGYSWTSPKGPPQPIQPGTLCTMRITVREQAPITLILPSLKEALGL